MGQHTNNATSINEDEARAFVLSAIVLSSSVFGIAFWYGVFNTVFFEHIFYIWVAATVALVASLLVPPIDALPAFMSWRGRIVLVLPSISMLWLGFGDGGVTDMAQADWITWFITIAVLVLTLPYLLYVLVMVVVPDIDKLKHARLRTATIVITVAVALVGYAIGRHHERFLTCYDFRVSGSDIPENCTLDPEHPSGPST